MEGDRLTPSVVFFDDQNVIVGKEAVKAMAIDAGRAAPCSKREVGLRVYHKAFDGQQYPPEVIEAWILNKLRVDTAAQIGPFEKAVITVPAYFDEVRRKATQDAGYMAGLDVMDIINEPTAAATAFGFGRGMIQAQRPTERFVVYDLGGGTFDVTVMELRGTDFIALATDGDTGLGGYDWDQRLVNLVVERFRDQHGIDPREDPNAAGHLWQQCEDAKRTLSSREKATVVCNYRGFSSRVEITRRQFDDATRDLLDITRTTTDRTVRAAGLDWPQIDRVLLVGGSTRMPQVRDMLRQLSGREPDASVAADEVVA
jgi:molecular chaperone DnaK